MIFGRTDAERLRQQGYRDLSMCTRVKPKVVARLGGWLGEGGVGGGVRLGGV